MNTPLVEKILLIFLSEGISTYTIQELAKKVNISTKTIYKNFGSKEKLLSACLEYYYIKFLEDIKHILSNEIRAVPAFLEATSYIISKEFNINNTFFFDLNQNYQDIQDDVLNKIHPKFPDLSAEILKKGIIEGTVQKNIIPELFMAAYARLYHSITRETAYSVYGHSSSIILENTLHPLIKGILTEKGLEEYLFYYQKAAFVTSSE